MSTYFVEGEIRIKIDIEVEADSLEQATKIAFTNAKDDILIPSYADFIDDSSDLMAGQYEGESYND